MKFKQQSSNPILCTGFTLLELMVAMSITLILLGIVTGLTSMSMDTYKKSRDQVRSARQAKEALDAIGKDFEAMVYRQGGGDEQWLHAEIEPQLGGALDGPTGKEITNACRMIFFTSTTEKYGGGDGAGDVSAVSYRLVYRDQISGTAAGAVGDYPVFTLYRHLVDPDDTFTNVLGETDLTASTEFDADADDFAAENVLVENIYELTVTFIVQTDAGVERITIGQAASQHDEFTVNDNGLTVDGGAQDGQLAGVEISITVLTDRGLVMAQKSGMSRGDIIKEYGYHYTKTVNVPRL